MGYVVLFFGLIQVPVYFTGITPAPGSGALAVSANYTMVAIQLALIAVTLAVIMWLTKSQRRISRPITLVILFIVFTIQTYMAVGYTGM